MNTQARVGAVGQRRGQTSNTDCGPTWRKWASAAPRRVIWGKERAEIRGGAVGGVVSGWAMGVSSRQKGHSHSPEMALVHSPTAFCQEMLRPAPSRRHRAVSIPGSPAGSGLRFWSAVGGHPGTLAMAEMEVGTVSLAAWRSEKVVTATIARELTTHLKYLLGPRAGAWSTGCRVGRGSSL